MIRMIDVEIFADDDEWAQGRYLVHGHDDVYWTDEVDSVLSVIKESLSKEHD